MKKATIAKLLVVCLIVSMMSMSIAATTRSTGSGTVDDPYKLGNDSYTLNNGVYTITMDADKTYTVFDDTLVGGEGTYKITLAADKVLTAESIEIKAGGKLEVYAAGNSSTPLYSAVNAVKLDNVAVSYYTIDPDTTPSGRAANTIGGYIKGEVKLTSTDAQFSYMTALDDEELTVSSGASRYNVTYEVKGDSTVWTLVRKNTSGGGGASTTVSTPSTSGGKYTVDNTNAKKGDTVTITTTPDAGKKVGSVTVTDKNGNKIDVTDIGNGKFTFVMPDTNVTVRVTFVDADKVTFTDVPAGAYYADAVAWAVEKGITQGLTDSTFGPDASCTRAQMVTFLWRLAGSPKASGTNPFGDVAAGSYYYDAVMWAVANGITSGTADDAFSPDATVNRAQSVTFLYRYAGQPATNSGSNFTDVSSDAYYANAVAWAAANGITQGTTDTTFSPDNDCVRGQIVTFMYRYAGDK